MSLGSMPRFIIHGYSNINASRVDLRVVKPDVIYGRTRDENHRLYFVQILIPTVGIYRLSDINRLIFQFNTWMGLHMVK